MVIDCGELRIVTDPWLRDRIGPWRRWRPAGLAPRDLAGTGVLLISHAHPDHLDPPSLIHVPRTAAVFSPGGTPLRKLRGLGFGAVVPLREWEAGAGSGFRITAVPSIHTRWSLGFVVEIGGRKVYFAGDAGPGTPFREIARRCGPLDLALVPVGGSTLAPGPFQRHLTPRMAAEAVVELQPRIAVPMHWGHVPCVPACLDRFRGTPERFRTELARLGVADRLVEPDEGVPYPLPPGV